MKLISLIYSFILYSTTKALQTNLVSYSPLADKNMTTAVISRFQKITEVECSRSCLVLETCKAVTYSIVTGLCQYHDVIFTSPIGATDQEGLAYYYIITGRNDWCPVEKGFQVLNDYGPCVKFHTGKETWYEANQTCVSYSLFSRLAVLDNRAKNNLIIAAGMAINDQFTAGVYIGLQEYTTIQNRYKWVNGEDVDFSNWGPDNSDLTKHDCVFLSRANDWKWKTNECIKPRHYVCEIVVDIIQYHRMMDRH